MPLRASQGRARVEEQQVRASAIGVVAIAWAANQKLALKYGVTLILILTFCWAENRGFGADFRPPFLLLWLIDHFYVRSAQ